MKNNDRFIIVKENKSSLFRQNVNLEVGTGDADILL